MTQQSVNNPTLNAPPAPFIPPTARQLLNHLERYPVRPPARWPAFLPLLMSIAMGSMLLSMIVGKSSPMFALVALVVVGGVIGLSFVVRSKASAAMAMERTVLGVSELATLRRYPEAVRLAWQLLPQVAATAPHLYYRMVAMLSDVLSELGATEAALAGFDFLLAQTSRPPGFPGFPGFSEAPRTAGASTDLSTILTLKLYRARALLHADRLTDADDALRQLRGRIDRGDSPFNWAIYRLSVLTQQVKTGHYNDALPAASALLDDLRPLGVEAGHGYAMMALSFHQAAVMDDEANAAFGRQQAAMWWSRATILLPVSALVRRFADLAKIAGDPAIAASAMKAAPI